MILDVVSDRLCSAAIPQVKTAAISMCCPADALRGICRCCLQERCWVT